MAGDVQAILPRWLVPVRPEGQVLEDHAVIVVDGRIEAIIGAGDVGGLYPEAHRIELPVHALIPGLINAHTHNAMSLLRGLADDLPLMTWLEDHIWPSEQRWVGPEFVRAGSELAMAEMLAGGTTCFNDNYFFPDVTAEVAREAGMRAVIGLPVISLPTAWASNEDEYFQRALEVREDLLGDPLLTTAFAPHAPYTVSDAAFTRMRELADKTGIPIHLHLLETAQEVDDSLAAHGRRPLDRLADLGLLGPSLLAVHMTQLGEDDIERIASAGVHVLHCPASNLKLASGICPVAALDSAGVNVSIGTDGAASNNTLDMFAEMRLAALLAKGASGDPEAIPAARAVSMATLNGARALGLETQVGSIEVGKSADLAAIALDRSGSLPVNSVISHLVYAVGREQVSDVWVAGQRVYEQGRMTRLDVDSIHRTAGQWAERLTAGEQK
ncbi:TRZ/ATZ family hydrolase [Wenzhouxiangella sp. AB-CW3]|uniref:TRZ/ATZ family hydrolase n=1 Tax=Wenzhouxiangella sp. AB-CW3 TaxID=2771012 RepID=UPI00168B15FB|nr:TRZ/ATZ family hydrolase [Wenzhouxiangella sp. AB-CW3]QOC21130.1 TRZ/ATZ family hydrolase [Wenzhouxiangella sp. AB-CW3]